MEKMNALTVDISVAAKAKFAKFFMDASYEWKKHTEEISYSENIAQYTSYSYLGG